MTAVCCTDERLAGRGTHARASHRCSNTAPAWPPRSRRTGTVVVSQDVEPIRVDLGRHGKDVDVGLGDSAVHAVAVHANSEHLGIVQRGPGATDLRHALGTMVVARPYLRRSRLHVPQPNLCRDGTAAPGEWRVRVRGALCSRDRIALLLAKQTLSGRSAVCGAGAQSMFQPK
jgi:hypothetical protein